MPHLKSITLFQVAVPLKKKIAHASHERSTSDNFVVRAELSDGTRGHGEGVPRPYVTGETVESCFAVAAECDFATAVGRIDVFNDVPARVARAVEVLQAEHGGPRGIGANAALCALELAILDAFCRHFGKSMGDAIRAFPEAQRWLKPAPERVRYSGAITAEEPRKERISAWKMRLNRFHQVKVKVGVPGQDDAARLRLFRKILGRRVDIRVDANEAWQAAELLERVRPLREFGISLLEQPVPHAQVGALAEFKAQLGIPVMLDESLCGSKDATDAIARGLCDCFNVRISKCGGLFATVRLMDQAWRAGLKVHQGCHPGETGILSAAGRQLASNLAGIAYVEGSYDRHVLAANVIAEDITFGYRGFAKPLSGPGLGVTIDAGRLEAMTQRTEVIDYGG